MEEKPVKRRGGPHMVPVGLRQIHHRPVRAVPAPAPERQRGCAILSGLREWEGSRRLGHTWAANTHCWVSLGEFGWEGWADEEILLSSCGLSPPTPRSPRSTSPAKPPHAEKTKPPALPPPNPRNPKRAPLLSATPSNRAAPHRRSRHTRGHGKGEKGKQPQQQKWRDKPPSLEGDESPDPLLGGQVYVPYTDGVYPGVVTSVVGGGGGGGECGWNNEGKT